MKSSRRPHRFAAVAITALATVTLVACGSDDDAADPTAATASADSVAGAAAVTIQVDADSGTPGTQTVPLNTPVSFHIVTATSQEFHLHGYDLEAEGTDVTITFTADTAGTFELESHATDTLLFTLVVSA